MPKIIKISQRFRVRPYLENNIDTLLRAKAAAFSAS